MIGQLQLVEVPDLEGAERRILAAREEVGALADSQHPTIVARGGGYQGLEVRAFPQTPAGPMLVVHLLYDVRDAMGANAVNSAMEALAPLMSQLSGGKARLRIVSNLSDQRLAWAEGEVPQGVLEEEVVRGIVEAWAFAAVDPYRAATHNKGIMNGIDAVALATGNDWRALEAGVHAYAAREGQYLPLSTWKVDEEGNMRGRLELPLAVGIVGGASRVHPTARTALKTLGVEKATELAQVMAAVGLAQNLAALRALVDEGIQRGHMALHARRVALEAGAKGELVEVVAEALAQEGNIRLERARELVRELGQKEGVSGVP
jgi:hydroxymethylglutaryl-CoA reductase